jgi:hypothetical protein
METMQDIYRTPTALPPGGLWMDDQASRLIPPSTRHYWLEHLTTLSCRQGMHDIVIDVDEGQDSDVGQPHV